MMTADAVGGVWTYAMELARALEKLGVAIDLAVMGPGPSAGQCRDAARRPNVTLYESSFALEWMDAPWTDVDRAGEWLLDLADRTGAEMIHLNGYVHAALPWNVPVLVVAHSCVCSWWTAVHGTEAPRVWDDYRRRVADGLTAADLVVAPTAAMLASLDAHYDTAIHGRVIPNGCSGERFAPAVTKQPIVFAAGRAWDAAKNIAALDAAAPHVAWPILVAGDCHAPDGGSAVFSRVQCLGQLEAREMCQHLAESAIYALPARYEPFGLSALEAALSGCALVLGDIPTLREVWGDAATYVNPDDPAALACTLNALITDDDRRAWTTRRARARALEFTPTRTADQYLAAYRHCLAQHTREEMTTA